MAHDTEWIEVTDVLPSDIILPLDNWRETPDVQIDELAKSIAALGLQYPPKIAKNKDGKYIAIDGNRRTFACQKLEKGYKTMINGIPVTLTLPDNWRVTLSRKNVEELGEEGIAKIRLHTTEQHVHFSMSSKKTQMANDILAFATQRGLTMAQVRLNKILNTELIDFLARKYQLERKDVLLMLDETIRMVRYKDEVIEPLHYREIGMNFARNLSTNVKSEDIKPILDIVKAKKLDGLSQTQLGDALTYAKRDVKFSDNKTSLIDAFSSRVSKISPMKSINVLVPPRIYNAVNDARLKQKPKKTWDEFMVKFLTDHLYLFK